MCLKLTIYLNFIHQDNEEGKQFVHLEKEIEVEDFFGVEYEVKYDENTVIVCAREETFTLPEKLLVGTSGKIHMRLDLYLYEETDPYMMDCMGVSNTICYEVEGDEVRFWIT